MLGPVRPRYTTGKLPKAFKIVPHLRNWEDVVFAMDPEHWSPHATYAATKMFVSQLNAKQTQRFLNLILLNKVRDDIQANRRLHFALFQALKKAVFKPGAFYKGVVLPLLKAGDCSLREAVIISSVIHRVSIPVDHSAAVRALGFHGWFHAHAVMCQSVCACCVPRPPPSIHLCHASACSLHGCLKCWPLRASPRSLGHTLEARTCRRC
jgi:Bystin